MVTKNEHRLIRATAKAIMASALLDGYVPKKGTVVWEAWEELENTSRDIDPDWDETGADVILEMGWLTDENIARLLDAAEKNTVDT